MTHACIAGMARINSFHDLAVWQKAMTLVERCYRASGHFPKDERFGLTSQLRRAAVSIPSNIAEGFCRRGRGAYMNHLSIALGSQAELETQVEIARRLGYLLPADADATLDASREIGRMLNGLITALQRSENSEP